MPDNFFENGYVPIPLALIVCDYAHQDPATGKHTLIGTFSGLLADEFPKPLQSLAVYGAITETKGNLQGLVRIIDANETLSPLCEVELDFQVKDPRQVIEFAYNFEAVVIPQEGEYRIQLIANHEILMERKFLALSPQKLGPEK